MEEIKKPFDKNLLLAIILPLIFIVTFFIYYQIDYYYSLEYWQQINQDKPKSLKVYEKKLQTPYKLLYSIYNDTSTHYQIDNTIQNETIPGNLLKYKNTEIYYTDSTKLFIRESCFFNTDTSKLERRINFIDGEGKGGASMPFKPVEHYLDNKVYIYDFSNFTAAEIPCDSNISFANFESNLEGFYNLQSPDKLIKFERKSYYEEEKATFPFLKYKVREKLENLPNEEFKQKILVNGEYLDTSLLKFDPLRDVDFILYYYAPSVEIFGWVK